jgi:outer membrane receptor protein involved in Fe transport
VISLCVFFLVILFTTNASSQNRSIQISGTVLDESNNKEISNVAIIILPIDPNEEMERVIGIISERDGTFQHSFNYKYPFKIRFSHVSFITKDVVIESEAEARDQRILMSSKVFEGEEVVVTAEMVPKQELEMPETIYTVSTVDVQQLASFDVFDLVSTLREVDIATQSMTMQSVNTRGFNSSANKRFLQLTDGIDNRAPGFNFPVGNLMGLIDLDISSLELYPGPASAKYGSNAINGVLLMNSRSPFEDQGLTFEMKTGVVGLKLSGQTFFSAEGNGIYDFQTRYAKALNDKLAFKITSSYMTGTDWQAKNYANIGFGGPEETHPDQPGYNGVNTYGDEGFVFQDLYTSGGFSYSGPPVTRTGYKEDDLVDYDISTFRLSSTVEYRINDLNTAEIWGRYGSTNSLYTGDSRIRLKDFSMYQTGVKFNLNRLSLKGYTNWQDSGNSYDVNSLARNLIISAKSNEDWYRDFRIAYTRGYPILGIAPGRFDDAREFADSGITLLPGKDVSPRFQPGTDEFNNEVSRITSSTDAESGAAFKDNSNMYYFESEYDFGEVLSLDNLKAGANIKLYNLDSEGTIFPDTANNEITNYEYGIYGLSKQVFFDEKLRSSAALRIDKNENFDPRISFQSSFNYTSNEKDYFNFSYQYGFRYPGVREQFINRDLGTSRVLGGLIRNIESYDLQLNSFTQDAVNEFYDALGSNPSTQARLANLSILEEGILREDQLTSFKPELVNTFEVGYRRLLSESVYITLNYYVSFYENFIGITRLVKPRTSPSTDLFAASGQINNDTENEKYFVYSNSEGQLLVQGASFDLEYISGGFSSSINGSYSKLLQDSDDPITPGFNTPPWKLNFEWGHREIAPNVGFKISFKYRTEYFWESSFLDGPIDAYGHFDIQMNAKMPRLKSTLKFGITNLGIKKYYNTYGGPSIGNIIFATYSYTPKLF